MRVFQSMHYSSRGHVGFKGDVVITLTTQEHGHTGKEQGGGRSRDKEDRAGRLAHRTGACSVTGGVNWGSSPKPTYPGLTWNRAKCVCLPVGVSLAWAEGRGPS